MAIFNILISVTQLKDIQASNVPLMVFDCSFDLAKPSLGYEQYLESHIAGAIYANLDTDLSAKNAPLVASGGRHPLPAPLKFAAWLSSIGFTNETQAVVYDRNGTMIAGRLWWMLQWLGHARVAVLDGGFAAWQAFNGSTSRGEEASPLIRKTSFEPNHPQVKLVDASLVQKQIGSTATAIVDARAAPRYRGEIEPLDPVAGHIPSALNRPFSQNFNPDGRFKAQAELKTEFDTLLAGRDPVQTIHHCGSGVSAIPNILAMAIAGYGLTTLYAGSWSDWCSDTTRPTAQG